MDPPQPLETIVWTRETQHDLRRLARSEWVLVSRWGRIWQTWAVTWFFLLAGLSIVLGYESGAGKVITLSWIVSGVSVLLAVAAWFVPRSLVPLSARARFDLVTRSVSIQNPDAGIRISLPLDQVRALEVVPAGIRRAEGRDFQSYQLNLAYQVDDSPAELERVNLLHTGDRETLAQIANRLEESTGIPARDTTTSDVGRT